MAIEVITRQDLNQFKQDLINDLKEILQAKSATDLKWLKSYQVRELLGISRGTLQTMKDKGVLNPTKIGGLFYYSADDINHLMNSKKK